MASAEHEPIMGVWGQSPQLGPGAEPLVRGGKAPPEAESILVIGCPMEPANLAPVRENSMLCYGPLVSELGGPECMVPPNPVIGGPMLHRLRRLCSWDRSRTCFLSSGINVSASLVYSVCLMTLPSVL